MTGPEMNRPQHTTATDKGDGALRRLAIAAAGCVAATGLSGCLGAFDARTDAVSPIAPRVQALVDANRVYPRWEDFPRTAALPPDSEVAARVSALGASSGDLSEQVAAIDWEGGEPAEFSQSVAARIDAQQVAPVTAETAAEVEAFAQRLRDRAKAPPPIDRP